MDVKGYMDRLAAIEKSLSELASDLGCMVDEDDNDWWFGNDRYGDVVEAINAAIAYRKTNPVA